MSKWFHPRLSIVARMALPIRVPALVLLAAALVPLSFATGPEGLVTIEHSQPADPGSPHISAVRSGMLETRDGLTLRLTTDLGSVKITQLEPGAAPVVRYNVHIETDARGSVAQQLLANYSLKTKIIYSGVEITGALPPQAAHSGDAQFWVQFEIAVPRGYSVEVNTEAGDIITGDIGGTANLHTQGGNIFTRSIGAAGLHEASWGRSVAKLETQGGHIQVQDVAGDLNAFTAGGHINVGNIAGDASLRTGGGHIRAGQIGGRAEFETAGGNITVAHAEKFVNVHTGGGQIDFGEVRGSVHAQTGGGGIRVMYVSGPMEVESSSGSICLTRVAGALQASTSGGTITAWINPDPPPGGGNVHLGGASQLASGNGDIIVFLPRNLAATIEATVVGGGEHQIEADPALHLNVQAPNNGSGPFHAMAVLNGGGAPLKLRTTGGKIRLQYLDSEIALRESLIREQMERLNKRLKETGISTISFSTGVGPTAPNQPDMQNQGGMATAAPTAPPETPTPPEAAKTDWFESWLNSLEIAFNGGIREDQDDFQKRLISTPHPAYPDLALRAGIHGRVILQVRATKDGRVEVQKVLEGEPVLADAAIDAVKHWRAKPGWLNGRKVEVISTVTFDFKLR
jgi:TonB family protein